MIRQIRPTFSYTFEKADKDALNVWLKTNKSSLKNIHEELGVSYSHLRKIVIGKRNASSYVINKLKKMGVKFPKN
jgi:hypothetical protein